MSTENELQQPSAPNSMPSAQLSRRRFLQIASAIGVGAASASFLVACAPSASAPASSSAPAAASGEPVRGGILKAAFSADPAGFDPVRGPSGMSHVVIEQVYSTLMARDLTSADVVYTMERMLAMKKGPAGLFLGSILPGTTQAPDPHTVVFKLKEPSAIFLSTVPEIQVVNAKLVQRNVKDGDHGEGWLSRNGAGTGSFMLRRHDPAVGFIATRFKDHFHGWEAGKKWFDEIEFRSVLDVNTRVLGLIKGDFHGTDGYLPYDQIERLRKEPNIQILEDESMRVFYFAFNMSRPPFDNVHFRRALNYAFDYNGFINDILKGSVARNPSPNPNNLWGTPKDIKGYEFDLDKARAELAKANVPLRPITINPLAGFPETEQAAVLFGNALRRIGIEARIEAAPWNIVSDRFRNKDTMHDMVPLWKSTYYADPNNWVGELFTTRHHGGRNTTWYSNAELDRITDEALKVTDQAERAKLYDKAIRHIVDEAVGIFVYNTKWFGPYSNRIGGIRFSPIGNGQEMRWAYFK